MGQEPWTYILMGAGASHLSGGQSSLSERGHHRRMGSWTSPAVFAETLTGDPPSVHL